VPTLLLLAPPLATVVLLGASSTHAQDPAPTVSTAKYIEDETKFSTFNDMLEDVGISASAAATALVPTNAAFSRLQQEDPRLFQRYTLDTYFVHRRNLVQWHLISEEVLTVELIFDGARPSVTNLAGEELVIDQLRSTIGGYPRNIFGVGSEHVTTDGIVHAINQVLLPPELNDQMIPRLFWKDYYPNEFKFNIMANLALFAGLDDELNKMYEDGLTLLAPPNRRFNRHEINVPNLLTEEMKDYTRDFVLCHMVPGNQFFDTVEARHNARKTEQDLAITMLGTHIWITTSFNRFRFQSSDVLLADQMTRNGVFHGINVPLYPPAASDFAVFTHVSTTWNTEPCKRMFIAARWTSEDFARMANSTSVTVFCPDDNAFGFFNNKIYDRLIEPIWRRHLRVFLSHHIAGYAVTRQELYSQAPSNITMLSGEVYDIKRKGATGNPRIGEAEVIFGDLIATDGYFHIIDKVLEPPSVYMSIYDRAKLSNHSYNGLTLFATTIDFVKLTDLVDRDYPLTAFVPYNRAFRRIEYPAVEADSIIQQHLTRGLLYIDRVAAATNIKPLDGFEMGVDTKVDERTNETSIWVGGAKIIEEDIYTRNGVMHIIDRMIGREYDTSAPTTSPAPTITGTPTVYQPPTAMPVFLATDPPVIIDFGTQAPQPRPSAEEKKPTWSGGVGTFTLSSWSMWIMGIAMGGAMVFL